VAALTCTVVTPEKTSLDDKADFVALPLYDGEIGIAPGHSPMIGRLGFGELRIRSATGVKRFYIDGGFVQVKDDAVSVLTQQAIPAENVDGAAARERLEQALKRPAHSPELIAIRDRAISQARAQLHVARRT